MQDQDTTDDGAPTSSRRSRGDGLWEVRRNNNIYYTFRYRDRATGRIREKGVGPARWMTLKDARDKLKELKGLHYMRGGDPIDAPKRERVQLLAEMAKQVTFGEYSKSYIEHASVEWRNRKHVTQWTNTLATYCQILLPMQLRDITSDHIVEVLRPIWKKKHVTATRLRQRIEAIMDAAAAERLAEKDNPARWEGNLGSRKELKVSRADSAVRNHPALSYDDVPEFMKELAAKSVVTAKALRLQILTATRPSEAVAARWEEFDLDGGFWVIPKERMKAFESHTVPLSEPVVAMLRDLPRHSSGNVFPGKNGRPICTDGVLKLAKRMRPGITCHGFRSTFRTWVSDKTNYHEEIAEMALAHAVKSKLVAAYRRTTMLEKRGHMMRDWTEHCLGPSSFTR